MRAGAGRERDGVQGESHEVKAEPVDMQEKLLELFMGLNNRTEHVNASQDKNERVHDNRPSVLGA